MKKKRWTDTMFPKKKKKKTNNNYADPDCKWLDGDTDHRPMYDPLEQLGEVLKTTIRIGRR